MRGAGHFKQVCRLCAVFGLEHAIGKFNHAGVAFQHACGNALALGENLVCRFPDHHAAHAHAAPGVCAAADLDDIGVAGDEIHTIQRHAQPFVQQLRKTRFMTLPVGDGAEYEINVPVRLHGDLRAFTRRAGGGVYVIGESYAAQLAARFRLGSACREIVPAAQRQRLMHTVDVVAAVVVHAEGVGVGQFIGPQQIAPPQIHAVKAEILRGNVDQTLHHKHHFRAARAAVRARGRGVAHHRARTKIRAWHAVDARHDLHAFLQRREAAGVPTGIADIGAAHGEEVTVDIQRQLSGHRQITPLKITDKGLVPLARPLHRAA